jgi:cytosine/adenosine deaminase-related metal-dependent hydrolase
MLLNNLYSIPDKQHMHIRILKGKIQALYTSGTPVPVGDEEEICFDEAIVFPGLINSHDHLDFNSFPKLGNRIYSSYVDWGADIHLQNKETIKQVLQIPQALRLQWGIYKNLLNGVTTVVNHGPKIGIESDLIHVYEDCRVLHSVQLEKKWKIKLHIPFQKTKPVVIHVGEGTDQAAKKEIDSLLRWNTFNRDLIGIHGVAMNEKQASKFKALIWCPDSNYFLVGQTAEINKLKKHTTILFGTDSCVSAGWNLWNQLRIARAAKMVDDSELYAMLTSKPASVWSLPGRGKIAPDQEADLVVARKKSSDTEMGAFYAINPEDLLLVMCRGEILLIDAAYSKPIFSTLPENKFSKICINGQFKYIKGDLAALVKKIQTFNPAASFPFSVEA